MLKLVFIICAFVMTIAIDSPSAQIILHGAVFDINGESVIGANIWQEGTSNGTSTNMDGKFSLKVEGAFPFKLITSYGEYVDQIVIVYDSTTIIIRLEGSIQLNEVKVESGKVPIYAHSAKSHEAINHLNIVLNPSLDISSRMGYEKDIDVTAPSLAFKVINTRGFNSTAPVRMLQLIDGIDNQSPGLNFSLGNFLGSSELDLQQVDVIVGASSPFYGPNAFNGVISMQTLDPFIHQGLSAMFRIGERNLLEAGIRYADAFKNKSGFEVFAYKFNIYGLKANDWRAENYSPITGSLVEASNPGGYDAVNIYGDEYYGRMDLSKVSGHKFKYPGLGSFYRTGYKESDLVDYNTENIKSNVALHFRLRPEMDIHSPEILLSSAMGSGTTVYQGDNRFSLRDILFFQHKLELRKRETYFLRAYYTHENAGKSYDPYFTALRLQDLSKDNDTWTNDYIGHWMDTFPDQMELMGYPKWMSTLPHFDNATAMKWLVENRDKLAGWHVETRNYANLRNGRNAPWMRDSFVPGTAAFDSAFQVITGKWNNEEGGTRFFDESALLHIQGEYKFPVKWMDEITVGGNYRLYLPDSKGTIFHDTADTRITNSEIGMYVGFEKILLKDSSLVGAATLRLDKNQNFNWIQTSAMSLVYQPVKELFMRVSYSSALRNPTLSDQYLYLNVGPAILAGHIDPVDSLITLTSFKMFLDSFSLEKLRYFTIPSLKPERVQTLELGIRGAIGKHWYADLSYYRSSYKDFLGYVIGISSDFVPDPIFPAPINTQVFRYTSNSEHTVITEGWSLGVRWFISPYFTIDGNYSFNELRKTVKDDPIIPAFNTPKHKYNIGISVNSINLFNSKWLYNIGCGIHYRWVDGFLFEGSPQFTGEVQPYGQVDAQVNFKIPKANTMIKIGASNLFDNKHYEAYGGPEVGRLAYIQLHYNF